MPRVALVLLRVAKRLAHPHSYYYIQSAINALEDSIRRRIGSHGDYTTGQCWMDDK